jgi:hypothetical protein
MSDTIEKVEPNFKAFDKISKFVKSLKETFGAECHDVVKYSALCKKTNFDNHEAIHKHVRIFEQFCAANEDAIKAGDMSKLNTDSFIFSEKIGFNLKQLVLKNDVNANKAIAKHLQVITYAIHPSEELKTSLKTALTSQASSSSKEENFFDSLMNKTMNKFSSSELAPNNLNQAMSSMQSNGFIQEITQDLEQGVASGDLDINKLLQGAMGMLHKVESEAGDDPQIAGMMSMVKGLLGQATQGATLGGAQLPPSNINGNAKK